MTEDDLDLLHRTVELATPGTQAGKQSLWIPAG